MAISVVMPALEMAQETGKIVSWRKKEGELVKKGEILLEVETDKAVVEIESQADGTLAGVKAQAGAVIPVGQTIGWLVQPGEAPPTETSPSQTGRRLDTAPVSQPVAAAAPSAQPAATNARVSPKARRLAREHGIDLGSVRGTGAEGEILATDILALIESKGGAAAASPAIAPASAPAPGGLSP